MSSDKTSPFLQEEMQGVRPLKSSQAASIQKRAVITPGQRLRRLAAEDGTEDSAFLSLKSPNWVEPYDLLSWKRDGVQGGVFKKLRLGKYDIEARLDLYSYSDEAASAELLSFITGCLELELRTVLIVHGRGEKSTPPARLKSYVYTWLPQFKDVLAFHSACPEHGGYGAVYVMLRKSDREKLHNRERHAKGKK